MPDDADRNELARARVKRVTGAFRLCLDQGGRVAQVGVVRSTGSASYDRRIAAAMSQWVYAPAAGDPCGEVTYVYRL